MSLSKTLCPLHSTGSTQKYLSQHDCKIFDWDVKNQNKLKHFFCVFFTPFKSRVSKIFCLIHFFLIKNCAEILSIGILCFNIEKLLYNVYEPRH